MGRSCGGASQLAAQRFFRLVGCLPLRQVSKLLRYGVGSRPVAGAPDVPEPARSPEVRTENLALVSPYDLVALSLEHSQQSASSEWTSPRENEFLSPLESSLNGLGVFCSAAWRTAPQFKLARSARLRRRRLSQLLQIQDKSFDRLELCPKLLSSLDCLS